MLNTTSRIAVLTVVFAVAVSLVNVLPTVLTVPEITPVFAFTVIPVGTAFADYTTP